LAAAIATGMGERSEIKNPAAEEGQRRG